MNLAVADLDLNAAKKSAADIIGILQSTIAGGDLPEPCIAAGDADCDAILTSADIIYLVNFVFKGGAAPCS